MTITTIEIQHAVYSPVDNSILKIGGVHPNSICWQISLKRAIKAIKRDEWNFHVKINGINRNVIITKLKDGTKSLGIVTDEHRKTVIPLEQVVSAPNAVSFNYN